MDTKQEYYELNRKYIKLDHNLTPEFDSKLYVVLHKSIKEIIEDKDSNVIVILGDKASGKTTEIYHFYSINKKNSLYIELKDIYSNEKDFEKELIPLTQNLVNDNVYLFFDSIDECRIRSVKYQDPFVNVLDKIRKSLINLNIRTDKIKFIFTSRKSDWLKDTDVQLIEEKFQIDTVNLSKNDVSKSGIINNKVKVSIYELSELNEQQKNLIAENLNVDVNIFKEDIRAQEYSKTPLECIEFIKFKIRNKNNEYKIEDFLRYTLQRRYRELNEEKSNNQLSMEKIEFLSKRLAAATLLCKTISIKKKESYTYIHKSINDIDAFDLFPEEDSKCLKHFLNSSLFMSNGENTVKFWDELCRDNIAYLWLRDRIANGKYSMIKNLLFQKYKNIFSPKQNLIIPIVFLTNNEPEFRKYLIDFNPELLFLYSYCCESLTEFDKKQIIDNLLDKYSYRIIKIITTYYNSDRIYIFFNKHLSIEFIINKLKETQENDFWRELFLIKLLYYSNLSDVDKNLKNILNDTLLFFIYNRKNRDFNTIAIQILLKQKSLEINKKIEEYIESNISTISGYIIEIYIENLYPEFISFNDAIKLLDKHIQQDKEKDFVSILFHLKLTLKNLVNKIKPNITDLKSALDTIKFDFDKKTSLSLYIFLLNAYIDNGGDKKKIIEYLLKIQEYNVNNNNILMDKLSYENEEEVKELQNKITSDINIAFAEKTIEKFLSNDKNSYPWLLYDWLIKKDKTLIVFLLEKTNDSAICKEINKTYQLFSYCLNISKEKLPDNYQEIIQPYLNTEQKKEIFNNFINQNIPNWKERENEKEKEKEYETKIKKEKEFLLKHIEEIRNADKKYQDILINLSLKKTFMNSTDISGIEKKYGREIADAYKQGIQKYWQICDVDFNQYVNEIIGTTQILNQTFASLTGLHIYFEKTGNISLDEDKAKRIIYWGVQELNSVPDWTVAVIEKYPNIAKDIIIPIINKVVKEEKENFILDKISRIDSKILSVFYDDFWNILINNSQNDNSNSILNILVNMSLSLEQKDSIVMYINKKIDSTNIEDKNIVCLFEFLYEIDLDKFIEKIFELEKKYYKDKNKLKSFFEKMFGRFDYIIKYKEKNKYKDNRKMVILIPLLFKYIDPKDDTKHENMTIFTPNERDNAQEFRNTVLNYIDVKNFEIDDRETLLSLLPKIKDGYAKEHINYVADELLIKNNDKPFNEQDIINIEKMDYLPPKNSDDLFRIVCDKLYEIKMDIETSGHSLKELYQDLATPFFNSKKIKKEKFFQKYILMEFRRLSRNLYSSIREPEEANNKKPDLQIWNKNWCVNIECKIADNWSISKLLEAIDSQLVMKYLKYPKYQHGILLLAKIKKLKNKKLSFDELINKIQEYAYEVKKKYIHIKDIKVIGIDYSDNKETIE